MKICTISFHSCPYSLLGGEDTGGMSVYLRELSSALTDIPGIRVDIFTRIQEPGVNGIRNVSPQLRVIHLKGGPEHSVDRKRPFDFLPEFIRNLERFAHQEKEQYDVIYTHYWLSGLAGEWLKYRFGSPLIHTYHTLAFLKKRASKEDEHRCRTSSEEHLAFVSDAIVSSSIEEKASLIKEYGIPESKIEVIYPGVNPKLFYPSQNKDVMQETGCQEDDRLLLYVGRINPIKGLMTIVQAFELLGNRNKLLYDKLKLIIVGGGMKSVDFSKNNEFIRIRAAIEEKKLANKFIFLGSKEQKELKRYYSAADALIVPSLYESFGLVVVESLACGTPVVVSRIGKMKTIVKEGKNGFSFYPDQPYSLANSLENFFSHKQRLWETEKIRQDILRSFSWEKTAKQTFRTLDDLRKRDNYLTTKFQPCESLQQV